MAIIKCPECGHNVSDKAPVCPSCGVEIAGKVSACPQCGNIYFKALPECPYCHHQTVMASAAAQPPHEPVEQPKHTNTAPTPSPRRKKGHGALWAGFLIALIVCGVFGYYYLDAKNARELEAYQFAMQSQDPDVLQNYLDNFKDAKQAHIDSVQTHLSLIRQGDQEWQNAIVSGSKAELEAYLEKYPGTSHKTEILHRIDSADWVQALSQNTSGALQRYLNQHPDGEHVDDANMAMKQLDASTVKPEERTAIVKLLRRFFQSINSKNEGELKETVSDNLSSFLGKIDATPEDVVTYMNKIYKSDVSNMNWHLNNDYKIDKEAVGEDEYEYSVRFSATQDIEKTDDTMQKSHFRITTRVDKGGKISSMDMSKIVQ
ncbi:zinc ribbon domain-containing protein [Prevotella sp. KH2C16]|uniref:zinc ribbon domain-containing protein n=1 Tax=Prevotella sp. KH2C16 TaxID=1855325 RepID=UPI0008EA72D1|nr:zinc ribbon domain-containing protein [Prevotella sp. KH2C16]SFG11500.1 zinc-ribbon domain-containing protein [Prevotella sp. KH2C16]